MFLLLEKGSFEWSFIATWINVFLVAEGLCV